MAAAATPRTDVPPAKGPERGVWRAVAAAAAIALGLLVWLAAPGARAEGLQSLTIHSATGDHVFTVEIAATPQSREIGLMNRRFMPKDRGMLFEFERDEPVAFWMKNTYIPLDMVFIARSGKVTHIVAGAEPFSETVIPSDGPCAAVLELNGGAAAAIGLMVGDQVSHPFFSH